jgi:8-oxo-dGTP pyrophosphatase MutT (NUDIX family)
VSEVPVRPASTVVLLRDDDAGPQALLVRRNRALAFAGGFWVFPGGAVDDSDRGAERDDADAAARRAAVREAQEEAGVAPDPDAMVLVSHWTTPVAEKKRFATWIWAAKVPRHCEVVIDNSEIHDYRWLGPRAALEAHRAGELPVLPPTYITLCALARYDSVDEVIAGERQTPCPRVLPRLVPTPEEGGFLTLYPGDVAYGGGDPAQAGPRHRAGLVDGAWQYCYEQVAGHPPLYPLDPVE